MNAEPTVIDQPADAAPLEQAEPEPIAELSIADHAKTFSAEARAAQATETPEETEARVEREHHSAQQRRERESGQFKPGKVRHRAQSQQATPDDVAAISEYTRRIKEAEAATGADITIKPGESQRVFELRRRAELAERRREAATSAPSRPTAPAVPQARVAAPPAPRSQSSTFDEPYPDENDAKYGGDYGKVLEDRAAWAAAKKWHELKAAETQSAAEAREHETRQAAVRTLTDRFTAARAKYPDFDAVALQQDVPWEIGNSTIDAWVQRHKNGPDVLYYLQSNPQERNRLMELDDLGQVEALSLLSQRFSTDSTQAGNTGSADGARKFVPPPKPPNPVRTEAQRVSGGPPPTDGTLSVTGHRKAFHRS